MSVQVFIHAWQHNDQLPNVEPWIAGVVDTRGVDNPAEYAKPAGDHGYSAYSLMDPNMLIHVYWLGGLPSDQERDGVQDLIVYQALNYARETGQIGGDQ